MKPHLPLLLSTLLLAGLLQAPVVAAAEPPKALGGSATSANAMTDGVVKRIDRQAGAVTIAHEPLVNLGMPGMTMTFRLKELSLIDGIKEGSRIRFVAENVNGSLTVVALQAAR